MRIDDAPGGEGADKAADADLAKLRVDLDLGENSAVGMHGVSGLLRRVRRALAAGFDLAKTGPVEDIGVTFAAAFIIAAIQAAGASDHAGIARAEQRRALVAGGKLS